MKATQSYSPIIQGVSQQVPHERQAGQVTEQVNMLPDPVRGLARRHGTRHVAETFIESSVSCAGQFGTISEDSLSWRRLDYSNAGKDYTILIRRGERTADGWPPVIAFNRTDSVFLPYKRNLADDTLDLLEEGGASAATALGKYVFLAGNTVVPAATSVPQFGEGTATHEKAALWVRAGTFGRTIKVSATLGDDSVVDFEYTTPEAAYPGVLDTANVPLFTLDPAGGTQTVTEAAYIPTPAPGDLAQAELGWYLWNPTGLVVKKGVTTFTAAVNPLAPTATEYVWTTGDRYVKLNVVHAGASDISLAYTHDKTVSNPNYAKVVTDLTNAYQSAVTAWIISSTAATVPAAIAEQLRLAAITAGIPTGDVSVVDSTLCFADVVNLVVEDGGDGTLVRAVDNEVASADQVSTVHFVGKVVKVRPRNSTEAFYLKAVPIKEGSTGFAAVRWIEGAAVLHTIDTALIYAVVHNGEFCVAGSAALLETLAPIGVPDYVASEVGDDDTSPLPFFVGNKITLLSVFQDRLLVGAGSVLRASRTGDYLNFFRTSVLTVPADDPVEMLSQGNEDDELRHTALYYRDLVIFGRDRQYIISGKVPLTPTNGVMALLSSHEDTANIPPQPAGNLIFYAKLGRESGAGVMQIVPGTVESSPEAYSASTQLDTYLGEDVIELAHLPKPSTLLLRTSQSFNSIYTLSYLDQQDSRRQSAWHRLEFDPALGSIIGMTTSPEGLLIFFLRRGPSADGTGDNLWVVVDVLPFAAQLSARPYLDGLRPLADVVTGDDERGLHPLSEGPYQIAFDNRSRNYLRGRPLAELREFQAEYADQFGAWVGCSFDAYVTPTNPFHRDADERPILMNRLVVSRMQVSFKDTSGFAFTVTWKGGSATQTFNGRVLGEPNNLVGKVPVSTGAWTSSIGRETRDFSFTIAARSWLPLTVSSLEWAGQAYHRPQRL
jgi:hypothetical protein